jgi:hypothetical protein
VVHCDAISMTRSCITMCYWSLLDTRLPIKALSVSAVICLLVSSLYHSIILSGVEVMTMYPYRT